MVVEESCSQLLELTLELLKYRLYNLPAPPLLSFWNCSRSSHFVHVSAGLWEVLAFSTCIKFVVEHPETVSQKAVHSADAVLMEAKD